MAGDDDLRTIASAAKVEVHGLLWVVEMMADQRTSPGRLLASAFDRLGSDPLVRLPATEMQALRDKLKTG
jgi:hypothetical protein